MNTKIALLRGINVGGQKKILMADLRALLSHDLENVNTYIQSGNIVFQSALNSYDCETIIHDRIREKYGFEVPVLVRTCSDWQLIVDQCPYLIEDPLVDTKRIYVTLMSRVPPKDRLVALEEAVPPKERITYIGLCLYILYHTKVSESKLDNNLMERKLGVKCTSRNWRTTIKLLDMCKAIQS